jgi:hypothetical protein
MLPQPGPAAAVLCIDGRARLRHSVCSLVQCPLVLSVQYLDVAFTPLFLRSGLWNCWSVNRCM